MDPKAFKALAENSEEVMENVEFLSSFVLKENGTEEMLNTLLKFYDEESISSIVDFYKETKDSFVYQGFDPARLIVQLMNVHKTWLEKNSKIANDVVSVLSETISIKKSETFVREMTILIMLFLVRGSNIKKIALKSVSNMSKLIKFYSAKYTIISKDDRKGEAKEGLSPTAVTLARIASCFPTMTVNLFHNEIGRTLATPMKYFGEIIPRVILSPGFAAVIPKELDVDESIHHVILYINFVNDKIINQGRKKDETSIESLITYHKAAFNSPTLSETLRVKVCSDVEIMVGKKFLTSLVKLDKKARTMLGKIPGAEEFIPIAF